MKGWMNDWVVDERLGGRMGSYGVEGGWMSGASNLDLLLSEGCWQIRVWPEEGCWQKLACLFPASEGEKK